MDPRQHEQDFSGPNPQRVGGNFGFNGVQNDPFNPFIHTDNEAAFDPAWSNPAFPSQQQHINGFDQGNHAWTPNPYQSSNFLATPNYGVPQREYEQQYSRSPSAFGYGGFDSGQTQSFSEPNPYDNPLGFGHGPLNNSAQYEYPGSAGLAQPHETISPQALQNYPGSFPQTSADDSRQPHHAHYDSALPVRRASVTGPSLHLGPDWNGLANATSDSITARGLHIKPTVGLSNATKSTRVDGFVFVGNGKLGSGIIQAKVVSIGRKRSLKAVRRVFESEKGNDAWPIERGPQMKKLKLTESKLGSRPAKTSTPSRSGSIAESLSPSGSSDLESDDDSAYYSESDIGIEPEEPSPLPATRPADPNKAVEYDVIKAVWAKKNVGLSGTVIRTALGEYWGIFKGIRDKWKAKATSLQQFIEKKDQANIKAYERRVLEQRRLLESCISLTLKHGHPDIIEKLGENPAFLLIFYQFLADRVKESEYTGTLIASILELITRCVTVDESILEKTKMDKVLPRLLKRGDDRVKMFAQRVLDNAADVSKQKTDGEKVAQSQQITGAIPKSTSDTREVKRERPDDVKKTSSLASKGSTLVSAAKSANASDARHSPAKVDAKSVIKPGGADAAAMKTKANHITAKPTGFFAGLKSASKKPGTSAKPEEGKISTVSEPKAEVTPAPSKSGFSFAATMAALDAQKEVPPVKIQETRKPETPEERKKRLRKEERRKLRVSFKADDDLVQIREFIHDPEEEMGHGDSQVRDVGDTRGEGQMLKMHKDLEEDEEDYEPPDEVVLPEWTTLPPIDFSVIDEQELARNYTSRGGKVEIKSQERDTQEQRELSTLMVIYTDHSDIPSSPREPSNPFSGEQMKEESFGAPTDETKGREAQFNARRSTQPVVATPPAPDISALLRMIQNQNPAQQAPQPAATHAPSTALESIFARFANSNQQQAPPAQQPSQPVAPGFDLQAALAGMGQPSQPQQGYGPPPSAQVPNLGLLSALLGTQAAAPVPQMQGYGYSNQYQSENDRKRQYEQDEGDYGRKRARGSGGPEKAPYKTKVCKYFQEGRCRKGSECSYLHE